MHTRHKKPLSFAAPFIVLGSLLATMISKADDPEWLPPDSRVGDDLDASLPPDETLHASPQQRGPNFGQASGRVFKDRIAPHWFASNTRFWYRNDLRGGVKEFVLVDAERGIRTVAFDHEKLAVRLSKAAGVEYKADRLPFDSLDFSDDSKSVRFKAGDTAWKCDLTSYECVKIDTSEVRAPASESNDATSATPQTGRGRGQRGRGDSEPERFSGRSPDGKWSAFVKEHNVFIKSSDDEAKEIRLSEDGNESLAYGRLSWAPDSKTLAAFRIERGDRKEVYLIQSSPSGGGRAKFQKRAYDLPGDKLATYEVNLFDMASGKQIKPEVDRFEHGWDSPRLHWNRDGYHFAYQQVDRGHQRFRVIELDSHSGAARNIIDQKSETFIWTAHTENLYLDMVNWLEKTDEIIYASERDGWRHLYLIDAKDGKIKNQITKGEWVVRGIDRIDEDTRKIWFRGSGRNADQDPYFIHYYRVNFDGTGLVALTEGNGSHTIQYSPERNYLIDTYSRVDMAPANELRRVSDGKLVCQLEEADIKELTSSGWDAPEVFVAKGRDGKTDIWGIICRPRDFDPNKKYPVIEQIYAGPQSSFVPKTFGPTRRFASLTDLGFIVVQIDGMGTANRSKAFHDVCWKNLKDAGFPDRILWHQAAAKKYSYYDISRVGIYGTSAGGQSAAGAVLFHPEFYKVAVANCGCHDNRMDKASWNEQWMGYPVGPQYSECSNIDNAHRLRGKLFLIVGEMDTNVPPESTLRFADALIKTGKDFDLLVVPGADHGIRGPQNAYAQRRQQDFFVRHLLGKEPPDRNAPRAEHVDNGTLATVALSGVSHAQTTASGNYRAVTAPPDAFFELVNEGHRAVARQFYKKYIDVKGVPVVASGEVADLALLRTYSIVTHLLAGRPDIVQALVKNRMYLMIVGKDQVYTDMPEYRNHPNPAYQNERVRGTGGKPTSFGEENLLSLPLDRYDDESIGVHEFCHTIDGTLRSIDPTWSEHRNAVYRNAINKGLWKNTYAGSNPGEFWAEICQSYFDCNRVNNWNHGPIGTREQLKAYDPESYELVRTTFKLSPDQDWRYSFLQKLPNVTAPPANFKIDPYYTKFTWAREFTVIGRQTSDEALLKANDTIRKMFAYRHDILKALIADGVKLVVLGRNEKLAGLPEFKIMKEIKGFDPRARVVDYTPELKLLVVGEENVLGNPKNRLVGDNQVIRVFAKALYQVTGTRPVDPNWNNRGQAVQQYELRVQRLDVQFDEKLQQLYEPAMSKGLWKGTAAVHDRVQYWAEGVLAYFDAVGQDAAPNDATRPVTTRELLKSYDPDLYALVNETMAYEGHVDWRFTATNP